MNPCTVCNHPDSHEIDKLIVRGKPHTVIADKYGLDNQAIRRHSINHLPEKLVKSQALKEKAQAGDILSEIESLLSRTKSIMTEAEQDGNNTLALKASKEIRSNLELLSKIAVKLREYQKEDKKVNQQQIESQVQKGLEALTDKELDVFQAIQTKILKADPNYLLDPDIQQVIDSMRVSISYSHVAESSFDEHKFDSLYGPDTNQKDPYNLKKPKDRENPDSGSRRTRSKELKTTKNNPAPDSGDLTLDDLEFEEISLDEIDEDAILDNTIPSEETDTPAERQSHNEPWASNK